MRPSQPSKRNRHQAPVTPPDSALRGGRGTPISPLYSEREIGRGARLLGALRWRGVVFAGTCLLAIVAGAVVMHGIGRREPRAAATGAPPSPADASAPGLRLPPDVLREYQAQIAALASERSRIAEEGSRAHADRQSLTVLETARLDHERRLRHLEEPTTEPTPAAPRGQDAGGAAPPGRDPRADAGALPVTGEPSRIGMVACTPDDLHAIIAAVAPICARTRVGPLSWEITGYLIARAGLIARQAAGVHRPQALLLERIHAEMEHCEHLPRPAGWSHGVDSPEDADDQGGDGVDDGVAPEAGPQPGAAAQATAGPGAGARASDQVARIAMALIHGVILARAQAEGGWTPARLVEEARAAWSGVPSGMGAGLDPVRAQEVCTAVLASQWVAPALPQRLLAVIDAELPAELEAMLPGRTAGVRQHAQEYAAMQAVAALVAHGHRATGGAGDHEDGAAAAAALHDAVRRAAAQARALEITARAVQERLVPDYATLFGISRRTWVAEGAVALEAAGVAVEAADDILVAREVPGPAHAMGDQALTASLVACAGAAAETVLAQMACSDIVDDGLARLASTISRMRITAARAYADARIGHAVCMPMAREDLVRTAVAIAHDAVGMAGGTIRIPAARPVATAGPAAASASTSTVSLSTSSTRMPAATRSTGHAGDDAIAGGPPEPVPVHMPAPSPAAVASPGPSGAATAEQGTGSVVHGRSATRVVRPVVIPAGSYADARVLTGVVCELGASATEPMLVSLDGTWEVPSGGRVRMRDLRVVADCAAYNGNRRVHARVVRLALCPPGHAQITVPAVGWLGDNVIGAGGVLAQGWDWNPDVVIPLAGAQGLFSALAGALKPTQQVTSVNVSTTLIDQDRQTAATKAAGTAAQSLSDGANQQLDRILAQLRPALVVPNNQEVTVVLAEDAVLPIPVEEWDAAVDPVDGPWLGDHGQGRGFAY